MRVSLAAQILSSTVAAVLKSFGPPDAKGTSKLCERVVLILIVSMCAAQLSIKVRGNHFLHHVDQWMIQDFFG